MTYSHPIRLSIILATLTLLVGCTTAVPAPEPVPWHDGAAEMAADRLTEYHVEVVASEAWTVEELTDIAVALEALPTVLLPTAEDPLRVARNRRTCLFGTGRYSTACPTFADDGTLFFYDIVTVADDGPTSRLRMLDSQERDRLLRMRTVAHGLLVRADDRYGWSTTDRWRQINGWNRFGSRQKNRHAAAYLQPMGARSAHLDLVTSAEAFFFREEDLALRGEQVPEHFQPDLSFSCQEFTRSRILSSFLDELDSDWRHNTWRDAAHPGPDCASFDTWANLKNVDGIDILFAAEQSTGPESLFGHLLIHIRHGSGDLYRSEGFEYVYQFGAVTDTDVDPMKYIIDGMTGNFLAIFDLSTFRGIDFNYLQLDQRTLRRYSLHLDETQTRHLMERIWESERRVAYPYYFTTRNCASMVLDLLDPVVSRDTTLSRRPIAMPTEILDTLARVESTDGGALLRRRPDDVFSTQERAAAALEQKRQITADIEDNPGSRLLELIRGLPGQPPAQRTEHYPELARLLTTEIEEQKFLTLEELMTLSDAFVEMERAELERANAEVLEFHEQALIGDVAISEEEVFQFRRSLYRHEDLVRRARQRNEFSRERYRTFRFGERRAPSDREQRAQKRRQILNESYDAAAEAQGQVLEAIQIYAPAFESTAHFKTRANYGRQKQEALNQRSLAPSNSARLQFSLQAPFSSLHTPTYDGTDVTAPQLDLRLAILDDHLGQRRLHGHRPEIEAVGLAGRLRAPLHSDALDNLDFELTILRYITLSSALNRGNRTLLQSLGWGAEFELRVRHHSVPISVRGFFGGFYPLYISASGIEHLAIGLGPMLASDADPSASILAGGMQGYILARKHLGGSFANIAFLRLRHFESFEVSQFAIHRQSRLRAGFEVFVPAGRHGVIFSPYAEGELQRFYGEPNIDDRRLLFGIQFEPLRHARP